MAGLTVRLGAGDRLVVNGAAIQVESETRLRFTNKVNILFGDQIMAPDEANTPARRIYFAIQNFHVSAPDEREAARLTAQRFIDDFRNETTSASARTVLDAAWSAMESGDGYGALKLARRIIRHEDAVLGASVGVRSEKN